MRQPARNKLVCNRNGTGFYSAELEPPATVDERRLEVHCCCPSVRLRGQRITRYISPLFVVPTRQVACEPAGTFPLGQLTVVPIAHSIDEARLRKAQLIVTKPPP